MTNEIDVLTLINSLTSSDYKCTDVFATHNTALLYCNSKLETNIVVTFVDNAGADECASTDPDTYTIAIENHAMAVAMLTASILQEGRRHIRSRVENIKIRDIDALFTDEIRNLLLLGEEVDEDDVDEDVMWDDGNPTDHWDVS